MLLQFTVAEYLRSNDLDLILFAPSQLGVVIDPVGSPANGIATPHNFDWIASKGFEAVLDGPMFVEPSSYTTYTQGRLLYAFRDQSAGIEIPSDHPSRGISIGVTSSGVAVASSGGYPPDGSVTSVQLYPTLIRSGSVEASPYIDTDRTWRAGLGIMSDGRLAFAVGRMSMYAFAQAFKRAGAVTAGYTDGGGSASMGLGQVYTGSSEKRRVPAWLVAKPAGAGGFKAIAIGTGVALLAWWGLKTFGK